MVVGQGFPSRRDLTCHDMHGHHPGDIPASSLMFDLEFWLVVDASA